jgi:hypothetical protein
MVRDKRSELEKRRIPRIWVNFNAVVIREGKRFHCQARQLSAGGILLATPHKELVGKDIQLELLLQPPSAALLLRGMVVYVNPSGIGVSFRDVSPEQLQTLQTYLEAHGIGFMDRK